tara:strand:+ start:1146 stop:2087 length:942 start_codon:yes stop_codon:yes gene_type:complete
MSKILILLKHLRNSFHIAKILSKNNLSEFIRIFIVRFLYSIDFIRNSQKTIFSNSSVENSDLFKSKLNLKETLEHLEETGFYDKAEINENTLNLLNCEVNSTNFSSKIKLDETKNFDDLVFKNLEEISNYSQKENIKHLVLEYKKNQKENIFKKLAKSSYLRDIAKHYLNTEKIYCNLEIFITNPHSFTESEKKKYAQYFHYDCDYKKFFKVFIYLNDVSNESGPHIFLKHSHKRKLFSHIISDRLSDETIKQNYNQENIIKFTKQKGSVIIEDTFGLHKGETPSKKQRLMLIIEFGNSKPIYLNQDRYFFQI